MNFFKVSFVLNLSYILILFLIWKKLMQLWVETSKFPCVSHLRQSSKTSLLGYFQVCHFIKDDYSEHLKMGH